MDGVPAGFRELRGVGPATEARLHEAGIHTWEALAAVLAALSQVSAPEGNPLRDLAAQVAERDPEPRPEGERSEAYVLRVALDADHTALRTTMVDVRHHDEESWAGWDPQGMIGFVVDRSGLVVGSPTTIDPEEADPEVSAPEAVRPAADTGTDPAGRGHRLRLDAGRVAGGRRKSLTIAVGTGGVEFDYRARLVARSYGDADDEPVTVGALTGTADRGQELTLCFPAVELPPRLQRLAIELDLRLAEPGGIPALSVVGRS